MLEQEFQFFKENQDELVNQYEGKVLVIKDQEVVGAYDDKLAAYQGACEQYEPGTFLIQRAQPGEEAYTQTFHSRLQV